MRDVARGATQGGVRGARSAASLAPRAAQTIWPAEARRSPSARWPRPSARSLGLLLAAAVVVHGVLGCGRAPAGAAQRTESANPPVLDPRDCGALTIDRCETEERCDLITGVPYDEAGNCRGDGAVVGCGPYGAGAMGTCARDPSGVTWIFPDTRNPRGWTPVRPCPSPPRTVCPEFDCGGLTVDRCEEGPCALITGFPYDEARSCGGQRTAVGCGATGASAKVTCARDPSGVTWFLPDTRNPPGWITVDPCPPDPQTACSAPSSGGGR